MRIPDLVGAAAIAGLGVFLVRQGTELGLGEPSEPGSGFMFWWIGVAMIVAAAALGAFAVTGKPAAGPEVHENGRVSQALIAIGGLLFYALALPTVGFIPTSALLLAGLFLLVGGYSPPVAIGLGLAGALASWFLFARLLSSNLPAGILAGTVFGN